MPTAEALRIDNAMSTTETVFAATAASQTLLGSGSTRKALIFCPPAAGSYTVSLKSPAVLGEGITVTAGIAPVVVDVENFGASINNAWFIIASGAFNIVFYRINTAGG